MNYETFIKEGQHLETLLTLTKLTKEERTSTRKDLEHLLEGHIFYPIFTWPPSIKEISEHNPEHYQGDSLCLSQWNFPKRFHRISLHDHSQYTLKTKKRTHQIHRIIKNINTH